MHLCVRRRQRKLVTKRILCDKDKSRSWNGVGQSSQKDALVSCCPESIADIGKFGRLQLRHRRDRYVYIYAPKRSQPYGVDRDCKLKYFAVGQKIVSLMSPGETKQRLSPCPGSSCLVRDQCCPGMPDKGSATLSLSFSVNDTETNSLVLQCASVLHYKGRGSLPYGE